MSTDSLDLTELLASWRRTLRGERKALRSVHAYVNAVELYLDYCAEQRRPAALTKANVTAWMAHHASAELSASTARLRLTALKQFAQWLAVEEGFDADPILAVRPPKLDQRAVPDVSEDELRRMLKVCDGPKLNDKRDRAALRLLAETGLRAAECLALDVTDMDLDGCTLVVQRGKGGKARRVRFSDATAAALDRYLRARRVAVASPATGPLWVSGRGRLGYTGLAMALKARAAAAGVAGFHIHRLRHTAATRWLAAGGSELGLMKHAGWSSHTMIERYVRTAAERLAGEEFDRLQLGVTE